VCFIWYSLVDSYKDLNTAKFAVIHELENQLPWRCSAMNGGVWTQPEEERQVSRGHLRSAHSSGTLDTIAFTVLYVGLGAYALLARVEKKDTQQQPTQQQAQPRSGPTEQHARRTSKTLGLRWLWLSIHRKKSLSTGTNTMSVFPSS